MYIIVTEKETIEVELNPNYQIKNNSNSYLKKGAEIFEQSDVQNVWVVDLEVDTKKTVVFKINNKNSWSRLSGDDAKKIRRAVLAELKK